MNDSQIARVTVAVVSYKHAPYLDLCLQSLVDQDVPVKIIVVDDHSPDDSQAVIRRFVRNSSEEDRFTLILHQTNSGLPVGLNEALRLVDTEFFVYLAGDDWSFPERFRKQMAALDEAGARAGLCYSDCYRARADNSFHDQLFSEIHAQTWIPGTEDPYRDLLLFDNWIPAPTVMFRTSALRAVGGFDEAISYEDHDSYVRIARDYKIVPLLEPLSVHRELEDGLGSQLFFRDSPLWIEGVLRMELKQLGHRDDLDSQLATRIKVRAIRLYKLGGDRHLVRLALSRTLRHKPDYAAIGYWLLSRTNRPLIRKWLTRRAL